MTDHLRIHAGYNAYPDGLVDCDPRCGYGGYDYCGKPGTWAAVRVYHWSHGDISIAIEPACDKHITRMKPGPDAYEMLPELVSDVRFPITRDGRPNWIDFDPERAAADLERGATT